MLFKSLLVSLVFLFQVVAVCAANLDYHLYVDINPAQKILFGTAKITAQEDITIDVSGFQQVRVNGTKIRKAQKFLLKAGIKQTISYQYSLDSYTAFSDKNNVVLSGTWYPQINQLANYFLTANLPEGFKAISEADTISHKLVDFKRVEFQFDFPHLQDNLTLVASDQYQYKHKIFQGINIETWFKPANASLADNYLEHSIGYLKLYQKLLGAYPFKRFAIVESPLPSGYSMPSYTLLGSRVIALPFIVKTSLGHEILHQWFGNSVYIDYKHGNWAEGLTNYLADYYYAEQQGQGKKFRKNILNQHLAYVNKDNDFPVRKFLTRRDKATSSIGYGKVAMIFHQLSRYYGRDKFLNILQQFVKNNRYQKASWHDLQREFESFGGEALYEDFNHWLTRTDLADIQIKKAAVLQISQGKLFLNFTLSQGNEHTNPYHLHLPLVFHYPDSNKVGSNKDKDTKILHFTKQTQDFHIELSEPPISAFIDPDYDIIRLLGNSERTPNLAWLMGKKNLIIVVEDSELTRYQPILKGLGVKDSEIISPAKINFEKIKHHSLVLVGKTNIIKEMLFAKDNINEKKLGLNIEVKQNPYNNNEVIALLTVDSKEQAVLAARKIKHYGKYSKLFIVNGRVVDKKIENVDDGIRLFEQIPTQAIKPTQTLSIADIVNQFKANKDKKNRIIMIGEQHNLFQHHLNQLVLIKKLKQAGYKVAIGLEMFQQPYQKALDAYLANDITESEFLTQSKYFEKWRYDYNLYKPIIDYALTEKLPLVALNIDAEISKKVAKEGMLALSTEDKQQLPTSMNFENRDYSNDLSSVYQAHQQMRLKLSDKEKGNFSFFLQSQTLWDESMAHNANEFLIKNPQHILVILAGNGHLRYRYGIADRLQRLSGIKPVVIVQDEELNNDIADYILITTPIAGQLTPKIGVYLDTKTKDILVTEVTDSSVGKRAGIKKDDIILSIGDKKISSFTELKLALLYADTTALVPVKIKRDEDIIEKYFDFNAKREPHSIFSHGK